MSQNVPTTRPPVAHCTGLQQTHRRFTIRPRRIGCGKDVPARANDGLRTSEYYKACGVLQHAHQPVAHRQGEHHVGKAWDINDDTADQDEQQDTSKSGGIPPSNDATDDQPTADSADSDDAADDRGLNQARSESSS